MQLCVYSIIPLAQPLQAKRANNENVHFVLVLQTLGNHEFDHAIAGVVPFMESLASPVVVSNIDDSLEPTFKGKYKKSIVIDRYNRKIGVIGVILSTTNVRYLLIYTNRTIDYGFTGPAIDNGPCRLD